MWVVVWRCGHVIKLLWHSKSRWWLFQGIPYVHTPSSHSGWLGQWALAKGQWQCFLAGKVATGLMSHWPCVTGRLVFPRSTYRLIGLRKADVTPSFLILLVANTDIKTQIGYVGVAQKDPSQLPSRLLRHTVRSLRAARKMKASEMICYTSPWTVTMRSECVACTAIPAQHRNLQMTAAAAALPMRLSLQERCVKCKMTRNSHEQFSVCGILLSSMCMIWRYNIGEDYSGNVIHTLF